MGCSGEEGVNRVGCCGEGGCIGCMGWCGEEGYVGWGVVGRRG